MATSTVPSLDYDYDNHSFNGSHYDHIDEILNVWYTGAGAVAIVDCVVGVLLNGFLLVTVLTSRNLRCDTRNVLIVNVAVADFLVDAFCRPLSAEEALQRGWVRGCYLHLAVQLLEGCASSFISVWGVVCLDALLFTRVARLRHPLTSFLASSLTTSTSLWRKRMETAVKVLAVAMPWVLSVVVIVPVVFTGLNDYFVSSIWTDRRCYIVTTRDTYRLLTVFFFFLPCGLMVLLLLATGCACYARRRSGQGMRLGFTTPASLDTSSSDTRTEEPSQDPVSAYVVASLLTLVLMGSTHVVNISQFGMELPVGTALLLNLALTSLDALKSTVLPLVWLLMLPDIRARAHHLLAFGRDTLRRASTLPVVAFDASVAYRNLERAE